MVFQMYICFIVRFLLVDYGKVFSVNELPQNSMLLPEEKIFCEYWLLWSKFIVFTFINIA